MVVETMDVIALLKKLLRIFNSEKEEKEKLIYELFYRRAYNTAYYLVKDPHLAQDITQETFISAFKHLDRMDNKEKLEAWLVTICTRKAIDFLRKQKRWNDLVLDNVIIDREALKTESLSPVEEKVERTWLKESIQKQIDQLPPLYKQVIMLKYIYEMKDAEIAAELNENVGTVKSRLHRARLKLRDSFLQEEKELIREGK